MSRFSAPAHSWLLALFVLLSVPVGTARAWSEDDERARAHFVAGEAYFEDQRFSDAAREFREAYELSGRPEMLINLARAHERAGGPREAIADLELLLSRHPQTSYREEAETRLAALRAAHPELEQPAPAAPPPAPAPVPSAPPPRKLWPPRLPTLIAGGAALASVVVAVGSGWAAHAKYRDLEESCDGGCAAGFEDDKQRGQRLARTSTGTTFAALALAGATAALWVFDLRAAASAPARLGLRAGADRCEARFRLDF